MPNAQPHVHPLLRILSSLNPNDDNPKPKTRPRTPTLSSLLYKPHLSMLAALKNKPLMHFGLGKRVRTGGCEQGVGQRSTPSSLSLESSRPSSTSVSRSESESGTSSMSEYMQTSIESLHSPAANPLVVVSRSSIFCRVTWLGLISPLFSFPSVRLTVLDAYLLAATRHQDSRAVLA